MTPRGRVAVGVAAIALVGLALRLTALGQEALWSDEYYSWMSASAPSVGEMLDRLGRWDSQPPLYFLVLHAWIRAGLDSDAMLRLPGALVSAAGVPFFALAARRLFPDRPAAAWLAAALFALSPFQVWYAQEVRPYGMLAAWEAMALFGVVGLLADREAEGRVRWARAATAAAGLLGGALTHFHGWFVGFGVGMPLLAAAVGDRRLRGPAGLALGVPLVGVLASAGRVATLVREGPNIGWLPRLQLSHFDDMVAAQAVGPLFSPLPGAAESVVVAVACVLFAAGGWAVWRRGSGTARACLAWGLAGTVVLPAVVSLTLRPVMYMGQRYEIVAQPFAILLLAAALGQGGAWGRRTAGCGLGLLGLAQAIWLGSYYAQRQKHPWDIAAREIAARVPEGATVRVAPGRLAGLLARYSAEGAPIGGFERDAVGDAVASRPTVLVTLGELGDDLARAGVDPGEYSTGLVEASRSGQTVFVYIVR